MAKKQKTNLAPITDIGELKVGMQVVLMAIPGKEKKIIIEKQPNRLRQISYRDFFKTCIREGNLYKEI